MADVLLGRDASTQGNLCLARNGTWTAELMLATTSPPSRGDVLDLTIAGKSRLGTVVDVGGDYLQVKCRVVAGHGKLDAVVPPRDYRGYQASAIVQDTLRDAGEVPGAWTLLPAYCANWQRVQGPCREALRRLVRLVDSDARWRVLDDGTVDLVEDDFAVVATDGDFQPLGSWGQERLLLLGLDDTVVVPGKSIVAFDVERQVDRVEYRWESDSFMASVWYL